MEQWSPSQAEALEQQLRLERRFREEQAADREVGGRDNTTGHGYSSFLLVAPSRHGVERSSFAQNEPSHTSVETAHFEQSPPQPYHLNSRKPIIL